MKALILLPYYNRPNLVRNALQSVYDQTSDEWELFFLDDGSDFPGTPIVNELLKEKINQTKIYRINYGEKRITSVHSAFLNQAIAESDADIALFLCDDDALMPDCIEKLNQYYKNNETVNYSYSHVIPFDPLKEKFSYDIKLRPWIFQVYGLPNLNAYDTPLMPCNRIDSSQLSWRIRCNKEGDCWIPENRFIALDYYLMMQMYQKYGDCHFTGLYSQFKGCHIKQLGKSVNPFMDSRE